MTGRGGFCIRADDVVAARVRIASRIRPTPLVPSAWLGTIAGGPVHLKLESLQVTHSFKSRGALNAAMALAASGSLPRPGAPADVVTASAGNHGRAIAWACEALGLRAVVFTPRAAPRAKTDAIRRHGAMLHAVADDYEDAERRAQVFAAEHDVAFVSPYDDPHVIAGAGTIGLELLEELPALDVVMVPVGGGGLVSGIALAVKSRRPSAEVVGVEVEASPAFTAARAAGRIVTIAVGATMADGLGGNVDPNTRTWPFIRDLVDRIVVVSERDLRRGMRDLVANEHLVTEGAGATAVAAVRAGLVPLDGRQAAVLLTGANIDTDALVRVLRESA
jgi:threonine dehydratase